VYWQNIRILFSFFYLSLNNAAFLSFSYIFIYTDFYDVLILTGKNLHLKQTRLQVILANKGDITYSIKNIMENILKVIDWLVLDANFCSMPAILCHWQYRTLIPTTNLLYLFI